MLDVRNHLNIDVGTISASESLPEPIPFLATPVANKASIITSSGSAKGLNVSTGGGRIFKTPMLRHVSSPRAANMVNITHSLNQSRNEHGGQVGSPLLLGNLELDSPRAFSLTTETSPLSPASVPPSLALQLPGINTINSGDSGTGSESEGSDIVYARNEDEESDYISGMREAKMGEYDSDEDDNATGGLGMGLPDFLSNNGGLLGDAALNELRSSARHLVQFPKPKLSLALSLGGDETLDQSFDYNNEGFSGGGYQVGRTRVEATPGEKKATEGTVLGVALSVREVVMLGRLGAGQNGTVHKALFVSSMQLVALKTVNVFEKSQRHQFLHELAAFDALKTASPHLVNFVGAYAGEGRVTMALEYMNLGSLGQLVSRHGPLTEPVIAHIARQGLEGLKAMHTRRQIHRDIKPANILINRQGQVKLTDFGLTKELQGLDDLSKTFVGTLCYFSPERVHDREAGFPSDVWSFGVTLIYLAQGKTPTPGCFWEIKSFLDPNAVTKREWLDPKSCTSPSSSDSSATS